VDKKKSFDPEGMKFIEVLKHFKIGNPDHILGYGDRTKGFNLNGTKYYIEKASQLRVHASSLNNKAIGQLIVHRLDENYVLRQPVVTSKFF
jgi:hypothetical protein